MSSPALLLPNFQRAWKVSLQTKAGGTVQITSENTQNPLRMKFSAELRALIAYWTAEISIYNLNRGTSNALKNTGVPPDQLWQMAQPIYYGDFVTLSAGYKFGKSGKFDPNANVLWQGNVLQPMWTQENVVDYKVTIRCLLGLMQDALQNVNVSAQSSAQSGSTPLDAINLMASGKFDVNFDAEAEKRLSATKFPRGQTYFGRPFELIAQIAKANNLQTWISHNGLQVRSLNFDSSTVPDFAYAPPGFTGNFTPNGTKTGVIKKTILGVPVQTQNGVTFRVLLDAMPKIGDIVQIPTSIAINQFPLQVGSYPAIQDSAGLYVIGGLRHVGDTRGPDWYTEISGFTANFFPGFLAQGTPNITN